MAVMPPKGKDFKFQVKLAGEFKDFNPRDDKILKQAFLSGFPNCKYQSRGQRYEVNFKNMIQTNLQTHKEREMRPPHKWKAPVAPIIEAGPTTCIKVPPGAPGTTINVPHPKDKTKFISVSVPATARPGQPMMVPVPPLEGASTVPPLSPPTPEEAVAAAAAKPDKKGWSTAGKVAAGTAGVAAVAGLAVGGVILGEHIAEEGWDATMEDLGDWAGDAGSAIGGAAETVGEGIADGAEAAVDWVGDAADTTGHFIMDLF